MHRPSSPTFVPVYAPSRLQNALGSCQRLQRHHPGAQTLAQLLPTLHSACVMGLFRGTSPTAKDHAPDATQLQQEFCKYSLPYDFALFEHGVSHDVSSLCHSLHVLGLLARRELVVREDYFHCLKGDLIAKRFSGCSHYITPAAMSLCVSIIRAARVIFSRSSQSSGSRGLLHTLPEWQFLASARMALR